MVGLIDPEFFLANCADVASEPDEEIKPLSRTTSLLNFSYRQVSLPPGLPSVSSLPVVEEASGLPHSRRRSSPPPSSFTSLSVRSGFYSSIPRKFFTDGFRDFLHEAVTATEANELPEGEPAEVGRASDLDPSRREHAHVRSDPKVTWLLWHTKFIPMLGHCRRGSGRWRRWRVMASSILHIVIPQEIIHRILTSPMACAYGLRRMKCRLGERAIIFLRIIYRVEFCQVQSWPEGCHLRHEALEDVWPRTPKVSAISTKEKGNPHLSTLKVSQKEPKRVIFCTQSYVSVSR